ncbi:2TM domain-containing protein [Tenacibaculum finnmarkense]|uniref:2TM domain-containing protein n=1 Tax=Tenacibaculum finnmarkense TaxID=2781243 RepID=UPI001E2AC0D0|nr:2TM domain-containing protein [Tenacibaculum finnmarkense]MCD8413245.1 2TM domain-containing protein [Tenacibaculum finnmarkense genomovar ulcerans]MCG8207910.1 2TM domain-containing protein [Tenacibaculum finnmarkense genomovar finnmarkense]MCG8724001.1 2TM domain-containing protein [Tenacibaculum finnmarkense]MCG8742320.1 2TM domain-containing protein [Tenacibaculum finnmarkense]MCG8765698.1 2TM domain-containing protein [Tenacibaculum finnmarkense]
MERAQTEAAEYLLAKKRVKKIKGVYTHSAIYCVVISVIIFVNLKFEPHFHWFWFSVIGWGIGLLSHWLSVFAFKKTGFVKNWEERKINELINENKNDK